MKKLIVYVENVKVYEGTPRSQKQILSAFNSKDIHLYDDYTNYTYDFKSLEKISIRTVKFEKVNA